MMRAGTEGRWSQSELIGTRCQVCGIEERGWAAREWAARNKWPGEEWAANRVTYLECKTHYKQIKERNGKCIYRGTFHFEQ